MVWLCFGGQEQSDDQIHDDLPLGDARRFSYRSLQLATNNFSNHRLIGRGGYAKVYRGVLPNGTVIAVKYYTANELSGRYLNPQERSRIVEILLCIRHPNIHRVMGYCIHGNEWLLVSEYVDNGSLYDRLHNHQQNRREPVPFSWPTRVAVCRGIARGLTHLHEDVTPRAVHRDIKPSNILLDANFSPKIIDFDLLKFFPTSSDEVPIEAEAVDRTSGHSDSDPVLSLLTSHVNGTMGYIDPEYALSGRVTQKSDVYAFGVTMLEIISGRMPCDLSLDDDNRVISNWALNFSRDDRVLEIVDPLLTDFPTDDVRHFLDVAFSCMKLESKQRPSMREVTQMLEGLGRQLLVPSSSHYFSAASSISRSISRTDDEGGGETELSVSEIEEDGTSTTQSSAATVSQQLLVHHQQQQVGVVLSGTGDLVERLSQTMVFKRPTQLDFPEAVFPPFHTREFRRGGSRNLYTF